MVFRKKTNRIHYLSSNRKYDVTGKLNTEEFVVLKKQIIDEISFCEEIRNALKPLNGLCQAGRTLSVYIYKHGSLIKDELRNL